MGATLATLVLAPSAFGAIFTVNTTADDPDADDFAGDGVCDTVAGGPETCTLRAAIQEANATAVNPGADTINFDPAVFTGNVATSTIATGGVPVITEEATINGGDCDPTAGFKPCAELETSANTGLTVGTANNVEIRALAITNANQGVQVAQGATNVVIAGNWFGLNLDETADANSQGVQLNGDLTADDGHIIGGETPADRNVLANSTADGVRVSGSDDITIMGNYFGVKSDGITAAPNGGGLMTDNIEVSSVGGTANPANDIMIGGTVSAAQLATPECDGPCNVIANSRDGIDLDTEGGFEGSPASSTTIRGNFIGLDATGQTAAPNANLGIRALASTVMFNNPVTVGGPAPGDRNVIAGNTIGGLLAKGNATVQNNYFGSNSEGDVAIPNLGSQVGDATVGNPDVTVPDSTVQDNRFAGNGVDGGRLIVANATEVIGNTFGIGTGGEVLATSSAFSPITITNPGNFVQVGGSDPGDPNTIGNITGGQPAIKIFGGDSNTLHGNLIGVTAGGAAVPNAGAGIQITNAAGNTAINNQIGGDAQNEENVISNSGTDAIEIVNDATISGGSNDGNTVLRNRGANNGSTAMDLFIDLRTDAGGNGIGNPAGGPNAAIQEPAPEEPTTNQMTGSGMASASVLVFKTFTESNDDVRGFAAQATVDDGGDWTALFVPPLPVGQCLSANQTDTAGNSSELAQPSLSIGPDPCDITGPTITIDTGPSGTTNDPTADFGFSSEAGSTFECRLDGAPFAPCDDPSGPNGSETTEALPDGPHTFDVRGTDEIGNLGPEASRAFTVDTTPPPFIPPVTQPPATTPPAPTSTAPTTTAKKKCKKKKKKKKRRSRGAAIAKKKRCKKKKR